jgi:hypothetical protein
MMGSAREGPGVALEFGKDAIATFGLQRLDRRLEDALVPHSIVPQY